MAHLGWREAIIEVLKTSTEAMHYTDIAEQISKRQLRTSFGATPANTVNTYMSDSITNEGDSSPFDRTSRGYYRLRDGTKAAESMGASALLHDEEAQSAAEAEIADAEETVGLINALGMYWSRDKIIWNSTPRLLGRQAASNESVDFSDQRGVYLLYDRNSIVYVGRAIEQGIGTRLKQHTFDRLNGRWDRFSWFGIYAVSPEGMLKTESKPVSINILIATMEALLIESVEPSQNRRRGDDFQAIEFLQTVDPEIEKNNILLMMNEFQKRLIAK